MFSRPSRDAVGLVRRQLSPTCRENPLFSVSSGRHHFARYHDTPDDDLRRPRSRPPRIRTRRDGVLSQKVFLDVNSLGQPGEVVIVPPRKSRTQALKEEKAKETDTDKDGLTLMLEELEKDKIMLDTTEVDANMEDFRSPYKPHDKLDPRNWTELRRRIESSFTSSQLSDYSSRFQQLGAIAEHDAADTDKAVWKPGTSPFLKMDPSSHERIADRIAAVENISGKELLVERILRDCWLLGVVGEVGQLDMHLPSHAISLLLTSEHFSFRHLAAYHQAKIDVTHSLNLIRITGNEVSCGHIRDHLQDAITRIREEVVNLSLPPGIPSGEKSRRLSPEFIEWLEKTYRVLFEKKARQYTGTMYYLAENKTKADRARSSIEVGLHRKIAAPVPFCTYLPTSEKGSAYSVDVESRASWFDRKKKWFRWALASSRIVDTEKSSTPLFDQHRSRLSGDLLGLLRGMPSPNTDLPDRNYVSESLTATVGQCLFLDNPELGDRTVNATRLGELSLPRIFIRDVPKIPRFIPLLTPFPGSDNQQIHRIRLTPSTMNTHAVPPLDLEIGVIREDERSECEPSLVIRSAKAVLFENSIDYLIPEHGQDLRFTRKVHYDLLEGRRPDELLVGNISARVREEPVIAAICDFLEHLPFGPNDPGDRTPLKLFYHISIPNKLIERRSDSRNSETVRESDDHVKGEYLLPPLLRFLGSRVYHYDFHGERLSYGSYPNLPPLARHNTLLELDMDVTSDRTAQTASTTPPSASGVREKFSSENTLKQEFHYFYNTACKLAFELGGARNSPL